MVRKLAALLALSATFLLAGCGHDTERIDEAERAVPEFHLALMDGDLAGIYQRAAPELQQQESAQDFVGRLQRQHAALGGVRGTERSSAKIDGERVTLTYNTFYEKAQASEEFVIVDQDGQPPRLAGYRLISPALE